MGYEDLLAYCTREWTSGILLKDYDSDCNHFSRAICNWWRGKNPGPGVEAEKIMQVVCSRCNRNLKSGTQCDTCGRWIHNSCGNNEAQVAESGKSICDKCKSERLRLLEEKLQNALLKIDEITGKYKVL
jgi:ribosomal protein L40E